MEMLTKDFGSVVNAVGSETLLTGTIVRCHDILLALRFTNTFFFFLKRRSKVRGSLETRQARRSRHNDVHFR
jgi:hypothetical protein